MADLSAYTFKADLATFARGLDLNVETLTQRLAAQLWNDITIKTPVDTGRARSGWAMALDTAPSFLPPIPPEGSVVSPPALPNFGKIDGSQLVYIVNNVEYIEALEDGHSKQAPAGMVRLSLAVLEAQVDSIVQQINAATPK